MRSLNAALKKRNIFASLILLLFSSILCAEITSRSWDAIGPSGNTPIHSFAPSPSHDNLIYALSGGLLLISIDTGGTWTEVKTKGSYNFISGLRVDSIDPQILYVHNENSVLKSTNGGKNWSELYSGIAIDAQSFFDLNPIPLTQSLKLLIYPNGIETDEQSLAMSTDEGEHWTVSEHTIQKINNQPVHIEGVNSNNTDILYGSTFRGKNLYQSIDGGLNWLDITPPNIDNFQGNFKTHPLNNNLIYAKFETPREVIPAETVLGVLFKPEIVIYEATIVYMRSADAGKSWKNLDASDIHFPSIQNLTLDPTDTKIIYTHYDNKLHKSSDLGDTWQHIDLPAIAQNTEGVIVSPLNNQNIYLVSTAGALFSQNGGETWNLSQSSVRGVSGYLAIAKNNPNVMYLSNSGYSDYLAKGNLLYKSTDAGTHWGKKPIPSFIEYCDQLFINPTNNNTLFCIQLAITKRSSYKLFKSSDGGNNWIQIQKHSFSYNGSSEESFSYIYDGKTLFYRSFDGLQISKDDGKTWSYISSTPKDLNFFGKILVHPKFENIMYILGSIPDLSGFIPIRNASEPSQGIFKSIDGGKTWKNIKDNLVHQPVLKVHIMI